LQARNSTAEDSRPGSGRNQHGPGPETGPSVLVDVRKVVAGYSCLIVDSFAGQEYGSAIAFWRRIIEERGREVPSHGNGSVLDLENPVRSLVGWQDRNHGRRSVEEPHPLAVPPVADLLCVVDIDRAAIIEPIVKHQLEAGGETAAVAKVDAARRRIFKRKTGKECTAAAVAALPPVTDQDGRSDPATTSRPRGLRRPHRPKPGRYG
jgi:hypothetical protein